MEILREDERRIIKEKPSQPKEMTKEQEKIIRESLATLDYDGGDHASSATRAPKCSER